MNLVSEKARDSGVALIFIHQLISEHLLCTGYSGWTRFLLSGNSESRGGVDDPSITTALRQLRVWWELRRSGGRSRRPLRETVWKPKAGQLGQEVGWGIPHTCVQRPPGVRGLVYLGTWRGMKSGKQGALKATPRGSKGLQQEWVMGRCSFSEEPFSSFQVASGRRRLRLKPGRPV